MSREQERIRRKLEDNPIVECNNLDSRKHDEEYLSCFRESRKYERADIALDCLGEIQLQL